MIKYINVGPKQDKKGETNDKTQRKAIPFCKYLLHMLAVLDFAFCLSLQLRILKEFRQPDTQFLFENYEIKT
jgi:hypothetical protein